MLDPAIAARLKRDASGLVAAIAQQYDTGEVLMLGWMDDEALHRTLTTGRCTYWSRSRQEYWVKGDTSGHYQWVKSVALDCDGDALVVKVDQVGAACHTGDRTCFDADVLEAVTGEATSPWRRDMPVMRREFVLVLLAGAVGAGLVVLAVRQAWAQAIFTPPRPLPAQDISVTGQQLVPLASALALAALACLAAVIATRSVTRRAVRRPAGRPRRGRGGGRVGGRADRHRARRGAGQRPGRPPRRLDDERRVLGRGRARDRHLRSGPGGPGRSALARGRHRRRGRDPAGRPGHRLARSALAGHVLPVRALPASGGVAPGQHRKHVGVAEP